MAEKKTAAVGDFLDEETRRVLEIIDGIGPIKPPGGPSPNQHHPLSFLQQEERPVDLLGDE